MDSRLLTDELLEYLGEIYCRCEESKEDFPFYIFVERFLEIYYWKIIRNSFTRVVQYDKIQIDSKGRRRDIC